MILVLGATGLLGGKVLRLMVDRQMPVRALMSGSRDWKDSSISDLRRRGVEFVIGNIFDESKMVEALSGCSGVINALGIYKQHGESTFESIHVGALKMVLHYAKEAAVQRLINVSCLGARQFSKSTFLQTKWAADQLVESSQFYWSIIKPSFMFSQSFKLLDWLMPLIKCKLAMPVPGSGLNHVQPVCVEDVAECLVDCIYDQSTAGKTLEIGGPRVYSLTELMELIRRRLGLKGQAVPMPVTLTQRALALISRAGFDMSDYLELLPLLTTNSACDQNDLLMRLKREPISLEERLPEILSLY